jgi:hypothetical protein
LSPIRLERRDARASRLPLQALRLCPQRTEPSRKSAPATDRRLSRIATAR